MGMMMMGSRNGYPDQEYPWWVVITTGGGAVHRFAFPNFAFHTSAIVSYQITPGISIMAHGVLDGLNCAISVPRIEGFAL